MAPYFTAVPNEVIEGLYKADLSGTELRIMLFIIRKTAGFHRESVQISSSAIAGECSLSVRNVKRAVASLKERGLLHVEADSRTAVHTLSLAPRAYDNADTNDKAYTNDTPVTSTDDAPDTSLMTQPPPIPYKRNIKEKGKETKENVPLLTEEEFSILERDYGRDNVIAYTEKVKRWFAEKNIPLSDPAFTVRRWLERDGIRKPDFDVSKYEFVINRF